MLRYREAALDLLKRGWPLGEEAKYDTNHALVLCRMHGFSPGLRFLYEHMRLFREVLQVLLHANLPNSVCQSMQPGLACYVPDSSLKTFCRHAPTKQQYVIGNGKDNIENFVILSISFNCVGNRNKDCIKEMTLDTSKQPVLLHRHHMACTIQPSSCII